MGLDPADLRFLNLAKQRGYGDYEASTIEIVGKLRPIPDFKLPPFAQETDSYAPPSVREMMRRQSLLRPRANADLCTGCGTCVDNCPVSALSMVDSRPVVDADTCIVCFCCQETCPEKAMQLQ
jgi:ferredoxin